MCKSFAWRTKLWCTIMRDRILWDNWSTEFKHMPDARSNQIEEEKCRKQKGRTRATHWWKPEHGPPRAFQMATCSPRKGKPHTQKCEPPPPNKKKLQRNTKKYNVEHVALWCRGVVNVPISLDRVQIAGFEKWVPQKKNPTAKIPPNATAKSALRKIHASYGWLRVIRDWPVGGTHWTHAPWDQKIAKYEK